MKFEEALAAMRRGENVRAKHWVEGECVRLGRDFPPGLGFRLPAIQVEDGVLTFDGYLVPTVQIHDVMSDWELYSECHDIRWAAEQLKLGRSVRRRGVAGIHKPGTSTFTPDDIMANDWELADDTGSEDCGGKR